MKLNYEKLMNHKPTEYGRITNSLGQKVIFVEHPFRGDEYPVIAIFLNEKKAFATDFFELDDMTASHKEYEPLLINGEIIYGI